MKPVKVLSGVLVLGLFAGCGGAVQQQADETQPAAEQNAPATASSVFPIAITAETPGGNGVVRFAKNAPSAIAGQTRYPSTSTAASAIPVGGQTAVALAFTNASDNPSLADKK